MGKIKIKKPPGIGSLIMKIFAGKIRSYKRKASDKASILQYKIVNIVLLLIVAFIAYNIFLALIL